MKKVLYSRFTKLLEMLVLLVAVGVALFDGIKVIEWVYNKNVAYNDRHSYEIQHTYDERVYERLGEYIDSIIANYRDDGMTGVERFFYNESDDYSVVIASVDEIFLSRAILSLDYVTDKLDYVRQFGYWDKMIDYDEWDKIYYGHGADDEDGRNADTQEYRWCDWDGSSYAMWISSDSLKIAEYVQGIGIYAWTKSDIGDYLSEESISYLSEVALEIKIAARDELEWSIYNEIDNEVYRYIEQEYGTVGAQLENKLQTFIICGAVILIATILLLISCGRVAEGKKDLNRWERGYTEIHFATLVGVVAMGISAVCIYVEGYDDIYGKYDTYALYGVIAAVVAAVALAYYELGNIWKKLINRRFLKDFLVVRVLMKIKRKLKMTCKKIYAAFKRYYDESAYAALPEIKKLYTKRVMMDVLVTIGVVLFLLVLWTAGFTGMADSEEIAVYFFTTLFVLGFVAFYVLLSTKEYKHLQAYNRVVENINLIYNGEYSKVVCDPEDTNVLSQQIVNLSAGFKESVAKQVEAEKMQIELVANVSHDLKTPLTSIISYVDLLSKEELLPVARDYVKILEDKSARLKDIVSDVFDLAKATSGEQVPMEKLDGVVLINQVLSDMSDRIEESQRSLRVNVGVEAAAITGNGQKLYRVFQNIIDNALKYSMPGTRIYLNAEMVENDFVVTVKNISEYEMDFTEQEILSRFTRGDKSRHSEGNGLGLSIAKSFTELCGGSFDVNIDGDVFKVTVRLR